MERWRAVEETLLEFADNQFEYSPASDCGAFWCAYLARIGWAPPFAIPERSTLREAKQALAALGANSTSDLADLFFRPVAPLNTRIGDLATFDSGRDGWPASAIIGSGGAYVLSPYGGVLDKPRRAALKAWRV